MSQYILCRGNFGGCEAPFLNPDPATGKTVLSGTQQPWVNFNTSLMSQDGKIKFPGADFLGFELVYNEDCAGQGAMVQGAGMSFSRNGTDCLYMNSLTGAVTSSSCNDSAYYAPTGEKALICLGLYGR